MTAILRRVFAVLGVSLCLTLAGTAFFYYMEAKGYHQELTQLQGDVQRQNEEAEEKLRILTAERDAKQAALNELRQIQEEKDVATQEQIALLVTELERRPVRVRVQPAPSWSSSGGTPGPPPAHLNPGQGDTSEAHGLLPEGNARRLGEVIAEMETINAAYASCRSQLFGLYETLQ